jgi:hypothetical protein
MEISVLYNNDRYFSFCDLSLRSDRTSRLHCMAEYYDEGEPAGEPVAVFKIDKDPTNWKVVIGEGGPELLPRGAGEEPYFKEIFIDSEDGRFGPFYASDKSCVKVVVLKIMEFNHYHVGDCETDLFYGGPDIDTLQTSYIDAKIYPIDLEESQIVELHSLQRRGKMSCKPLIYKETGEELRHAKRAVIVGVFKLDED